MVRKMGFLLILFLACLSLEAVVGGDVVAQEKLDDAKMALEKARGQMADVLSPDTFARAQASFEEARKKTEGGGSLEQIRELTNQAIELANTAMRNTELARVTFTDAIPVRQKALDAKAPELAQRAWTDADRRFYEAANALERGNANDAKKKGAEARDLFQSAELLAIKEGILGETRTLLAKLDQEEIDKVVPLTYGDSKQYLDKAEQLLDKDRYAREDAEALTRVALYEAKHASDIAERVRKAEKEKVSLEKVYRDFEHDLMGLGKEAGVSLAFDSGLESQVTVLKERVAKLVQEQQTLKTELADLKQKYTGTQEDRMAMREELEKERIKRERIERVINLFSPSEARVLQEDTRVIIRLTGFTFPSGTAVIEPQYFTLLTKVQKAIAEFPAAEISIEGHTDSMGDDDSNKELSQKRSDAIRTYLVANLGINPSRILAMGYGETKPIASNDTNEGRAMNRRVDVVIEPKD
jgi:outer membrane protein OmpA-like peptidoglycan-associated protein